MLDLLGNHTQIRFGIETCFSYHSLVFDISALDKWYSHAVVMPYP